MASHVPLVIDTGSSCLTLPCEIFDALMSWLPVRCCSPPFVGTQMQCAPSSQPDFNGVVSCPIDKTCYIAARTTGGGVYNESLPILSFGLTVNGTLLRLPLSDLLLPWTHQDDNQIIEGTDFNQRLCIHRGASLTTNINGYTSPIIMGTRALTPFYTVFDMELSQIGLAQKDTIPPSLIDLQCVIRRTCIGMQHHDSPSNLCIDPDCDDYYFFELDPIEKTCHLSSSFHILVGIMIAFFIVMETGLNEWLMSMSKKIERTISMY